MRTDILGVGFDPITLPQAVSAGVALARDAEFHYVVTPNPEFVQLAADDDEFRSILYHADLVLADGIGIIHAAKILGTPLPGRVTGIDFAAGLMQEMARSTDLKLFLLGAKPGVAEKAAARLMKTYPGLQVVGTHDGYFQDDAPVVAEIKASGANVLFVCLGAPKQEQFMHAHRQALHVKLMAGLGGTLDSFAGTVRRAPRWMIRCNLEWLYRLIKEPKRFGRMLRLPKYILAAKKEGRRRKHG